MIRTVFGQNQWNPDDFILAYSHRFTETPAFTQNSNHISNRVNPNHREGFDNISLLTKETYSSGAKAEITCSFEGLGCPEIIFVEKPELCEDGATRYGACFEIVLYTDGVNVWRHFREDGKCFWHKRLGVNFPVEENVPHHLTAEYKDNYLTVTVDGHKFTLRTEDMFEQFHFGLTLCEGIARVYDMETE